MLKILISLRFNCIIGFKIKKCNPSLALVDASHQVEIVKDTNGVEKYQCLQCGKVFSDRSNCKKHIKIIHFGEKEARDCCPYCQKLMLKKNISQHVKNSCLLRMNYV